MRWTLAGIGIALAALASMWAGNAGQMLAESGPLAGLGLIVLGSAILAWPLRKVWRADRGREASVGGGLLVLIGTVAGCLVLGPSGGWGVALVVLAMLGVSLLAVGSSGGAATSATEALESVDPLAMPARASDADRPARAA